MKVGKHDHKGTCLIKLAIFSLFLLMPFLVFLPNAFYYGFNEQAIAQEKTEQVPIYYDTNEINEYTDFVTGKAYHWSNHYQSTGQPQYATLMSIYANDFLNNYTGYNASIYIMSISSANGIYLLPSNISGSAATRIGGIEFDFIFNSIGDGISRYWDDIKQYFKPCYNYIKDYQPLTTTMSITDSMSYAWDSVWQNDLFSWVDNSALKTPIDNFVSVFGINEYACISQYLIYLMSLMAIYIVFDIIIQVFVAITHFMSKEKS